jgi:hypothetical protein
VHDVDFFVGELVGFENAVVTKETYKEAVGGTLLGGGANAGGQTDVAPLDRSRFVFGIDVALTEDGEKRLLPLAPGHRYRAIHPRTHLRLQSTRPPLLLGLRYICIFLEESIGTKMHSNIRALC